MAQAQVQVIKFEANSDMAAVVLRVSEIVAKVSGNKLGTAQAHMVEARMSKRMLDLKIVGAQAYLNYLEQHYDDEKNVLIGLLTTHHTFFFREFIQFEFLRTQLPDLVKAVRARGDKTLTIWSAACSRGQEVYSMAMFLQHYLPIIDSQMGFEIWGTDIDASSVQLAKNGVYHASELKSVATTFLGEHWARGKDAIADYMKARKSLTDHIHFSSANLLELPQGRPRPMFDVVFCRNVLIYFAPADIKKIIIQLLASMYPTGILLTGVSEPLGNYSLEVTGIGPSVYRHKVAAKLALVKSATVQTAPATHVQEIFAPGALSGPLNVLCVDDSAPVLAMLKKIFDSDPMFKVVGNAKNGIEADAFIKSKQERVDVMTLDIHMPEMDGIAYLKKHYNSSHPPVVMISSASREDSSTAMESMRLGACDFVEKPALNNLQERGEEIKTKLLMAFEATKAGRPQSLTSLDREIGHELKVTHPDQKLIMTLCGLSRKKDLTEYLKALPANRPPIILLFEGHKNILPALADEMKKDFSGRVEYIENAQAFFQEGRIYIGDFKSLLSDLSKNFQSRQSVFCLFGNISDHGIESLKSWKNLHILIEDFPNQKKKIKEIAADSFPWTSFGIGTVKFLAKEGA